MHCVLHASRFKVPSNPVKNEKSKTKSGGPNYSIICIHGRTTRISFVRNLAQGLVGKFVNLWSHFSFLKVSYFNEANCSENENYT